ncbi:unnamed protein product [Rhizoctonia solani]|uniref:Uncharacterized protein n=1 Tax=Rhizoctonia solani TaxID=456999 RepID=A0A8H2WCB3_9AGAM|nr:unnamed protein product [Rhizoctonia solani]
MFTFSTAKGDRSQGGDYLRRIQREIKNKVRGPNRTDKGESNQTWKVLEKSLRALRNGAQLIPPLGSAIDGLISILGIYEEASKAHKDYENVALSLVATIDILKQQLQSSKSARVNDKILEIASLIEQEVILLRRSRARNMPRRIIATSENQDAIRSYQRIEQLFHRIQATRDWDEHLEDRP